MPFAAFCYGDKATLHVNFALVFYIFDRDVGAQT